MRYILALMLSLLMVSTVALADVDVGTTLQVQSKSLPLYTTADITSKIVTNITQGQNLITIYKQGIWIKVADPQTGEIGWIKQNDLINASSQSGPVVHHYIVNQKDANGKNQRYEVTEFSSVPQVISNQDAQKFVAQMHQQQQQMQNDMNNTMVDMMHNFNDMQKMFWNNFPPVFVVHDNNPAANSNMSTNSTNQNSVPAQQQNK